MHAGAKQPFSQERHIAINTKTHGAAQTSIRVDVRLAAALPPAAQRRRPRPRRRLAAAAADPVAVQLLPLCRPPRAAVILVHDWQAGKCARSERPPLPSSDCKLAVNQGANASQNDQSAMSAKSCMRQEGFRTPVSSTCFPLTEGMAIGIVRSPACSSNRQASFRRASMTASSRLSAAASSGSTSAPSVVASRPHTDSKSGLPSRGARSSSSRRKAASLPAHHTHIRWRPPHYGVECLSEGHGTDTDVDPYQGLRQGLGAMLKIACERAMVITDCPGPRPVVWSSCLQGQRRCTHQIGHSSFGAHLVLQSPMRR